jgi:hypothetical protein
MNEKNMYTVEELSMGDMFLLPHWYTGEKRLYMKINPIDSEDGYTFNAVCLLDGNLYDVRDDCEVQLVQVNFTY